MQLKGKAKLCDFIFYFLPLILGNFISELSVPPTNLVILNKIHPYSFPPAREVCAHTSLAGTLLLYIALYASKVFSRIKAA